MSIAVSRDGTPDYRHGRVLKKLPNFVLGSKASSTFLRRYASGVFSPVALLDDLFEHPEEEAVCISAIN
jgi:hypothetical protein